MTIKKLLAICIIFLFIGVAVAPSINSSFVKTSDDLVEVTSQACGIKGFGNTTVKLTKQQYQNLEQYLVEFRARLNQTTTREEAVPLFKDAVVELNKYGLLPKGMNVEQAQLLITGGNEYPGVNKLKQKIAHESSFLDSNRIINSFCLLEAHGITNLDDLNFFFILFNILRDFAKLLQWDRFPNLIYSLGLLGIYSQLKPLRFIDIFRLDSCQLSTYGLSGNVKYDEISAILVGLFTGFKITTLDVYGHSYYFKGTYLGFADVVYQL